MPRFRVAAAVVLATLLAFVGDTELPAGAESFPLTSMEIVDDVAASVREWPCGGSGGSCHDMTLTELEAVIMTPVFFEAGAGQLSVTPSPMTLSRYDNHTALYPFRQPETPYRRAFWHPGIGLWQIDSGPSYWNDLPTWARIAWPNNGLFFHFRDVLSPNTGLPKATRRANAWSSWVGCRQDMSRCQNWFSSHYTPDVLVNVTMNGLVGRWGGVQIRSCTWQGPYSVTCYLIAPGAAQGNTWWWLDPVDGDRVHYNNVEGGSHLSPLTHSFWNFSVVRYEWRVWMPEYTGYDEDIWAQRKHSDNPRGALAWAESPAGEQAMAAGLVPLGTSPASGPTLPPSCGNVVRTEECAQAVANQVMGLVWGLTEFVCETAEAECAEFRPL